MKPADVVLEEKLEEHFSQYDSSSGDRECQHKMSW